MEETLQQRWSHLLRLCKDEDLPNLFRSVTEEMSIREERRIKARSKAMSKVYTETEVIDLIRRLALQPPEACYATTNTGARAILRYHEELKSGRGLDIRLPIDFEIFPKKSTVKEPS